jgi:hypothetical protein
MAFEDRGAHITSTNTLKHAVLLVEADGLSAAILDHALGDGDSSVLCTRLEERRIRFMIYSGFEKWKARAQVRLTSASPPRMKCLWLQWRIKSRRERRRTNGGQKECDLKDLEKSDLETAKEAQTRNCLVCRTPFLSAWAGERICVRCKTTSTWRGGGLKQTTPAKSSTRSKRLE